MNNTKNRKSNKNGSKKMWIIVLLLLLTPIILIYLMRTLLKTVVDAGPIVCYLSGYEWRYMSPGPRGCFKEYPDGGKTCRSNNECVSNLCLVSSLPLGDKDKLPKNNLVGKCSKNGPVIGKDFVMCGSASIENGTVVEDMRDCIY